MSEQSRDEALRAVGEAIARLVEVCRLSEPVRLVIECSKNADNLTIPYSLVRPVTRKGEPAKPRPVSRDPADAEEAIKIVLFYANHRRTAPELVQDIEDRWPGKWTEGHICNTASQMARGENRELVNHNKDPGDDFGKGYGLESWEPDVKTTEK